MVAGRAKYASLSRYLAQLPAEQQTVRLTFAEVKALLGSAMPASAYSANYWRGTIATGNWHRGGWRATLARPDAVCFTRLPRTSP